MKNATPEPRRPGGPFGPKRPGGVRPDLWVTPGTEPPPLPIVLTIGNSIQFSSVDDVTPIGATLIGSINTQGLSGSWWFTYGTTPAMGTTTPTISAPASEIPLAITVELANLVVGQTYYFAAVGQTAAGTITAYQLSFVYESPQTPATPANVAPSPSPTALTLPHFEWPFTMVYGTPHVQYGTQITSSDGANVVQQDSDQEILSCVDAIVSCQIGEWPEVPSFGIHDQAFQQIDYADGSLAIDTLGLQSIVQLWEPRATVQVLQNATISDAVDGNWSVVLNVTVSTTS